MKMIHLIRQMGIGRTGMIQYISFLEKWSMTSGLFKRLLAAVVSLALSITYSYAVEGESVLFGWGYGPVANAIFWPSGQPYGPGSTSSISPGSVFVGLDYARRPWLASLIIVDAAYLQHQVDNGEKQTIRERVILSIMYMWRFIYLNHGNWSLYSGAGLGLSMGFQSNELDFKMMPVLQSVPIGASYGRKVYCFAETGAGMSLLGVRLGVGCRF